MCYIEHRREPANKHCIITAVSDRMGTVDLEARYARIAPLRQDALDEFVWKEIIRLLEDPRLVQSEIDRRRETARNADPLRKRDEELRREKARLEKSSERLITAYQESLLTLPQLRHRIPELRKQLQAIESELQSLELDEADQSKYRKRLRITMGGDVQPKTEPAA